MPQLAPFLRPFAGAPTVLALDARPRRSRRTADGRLIGRVIRPSAALAAHYDARLLRLVDEMGRSVQYWLAAAYRRQGERISLLAADDAAYIVGRGPLGDGSCTVRPTGVPRGGLEWEPCLAQQWDLPTCPEVLALDARPAVDLAEVVRRLRRRWLTRFDEASLDLARHFAAAVHRRSDAELRKILRRAGISVEFRPSRAVRDALSAIVQENVSLIRSIPEQYLSQVEGSVMRSVVAGRDLATLTAELQHHHGVTRRRAEFVALDQNQKATSSVTRLRYLDVGIERAIWRHSWAGKEPRPSHVANDGKEFDVRKGWYDPHEKKYIQPGFLIHCRCFSQPILPR